MQLYMNSVQDIHLIVLSEYCYIDMKKYKYTNLPNMRSDVQEKLIFLRKNLNKNKIM